jgi:hypothetical protein
MKIFTDLSVSSRPHRPRSTLPQPALRLDFVAEAYHPGGFGPTITFSRSGAARYHDAAGVMQVAAADEPRLDHDRGTGNKRGLLIEAARTNLVLHSDAPASQVISVTAQMYALSFWGTGSITLSGAHADALTGAAAPARAVLIFTPTAGTLTLTVSGDVQLAQLEAGNCATSYIPTAGSAVNRAADRARVVLGPWWNPAEGTMLVEWLDINQAPGNTRIIGFDPSPRTLMGVSGTTGTGGNNAQALTMFNGSPSIFTPSVADVTKGIQRGAAAWSASGRTIAGLGGLATDAAPLTNSTPPTEIYLGTSAASSGLHINGCLRKITYYPRRLPDAQLLSLVP